MGLELEKIDLGDGLIKHLWPDGTWLTINKDDKEHTHGIRPSYHGMNRAGMAWKSREKFHNERGPDWVDSSGARSWTLENRDLYGGILLWS